jgi:hypothetical protein
MGTKLQELRDGCFANAMDDEPMFVLLARDPSAPAKVRDWADQRKQEIEKGQRPRSDMLKVADARQCADDMEMWRVKNDGAWRTGLFANVENFRDGQRKSASEGDRFLGMTLIEAQAQRVKEGTLKLHDWGPSTVGHGTQQCRRCKLTNLEASALGLLNECDS